ncbi:hypothetical protein F4802DRAFT_100064 [Xylaria palmicola]|nr:hypothetical protein F4802DRAFT_100064 [Xylaria palmicola]
MRVWNCLWTAMAVAMSTSPARALAIGTERSAPEPALILRDPGCHKEAVDTCVTSTGQGFSTCFIQLCAGRPTERAAKRQDNCTEDNLLECAILEWNEAQTCFQQLCL